MDEVRLVEQHNLAATSNTTVSDADSTVIEPIKTDPKPTNKVGNVLVFTFATVFVCSLAIFGLRVRYLKQ